MEGLFGSQNKNKNMQMRHTRCVEKVFEKDITSIAKRSIETSLQRW